MPAPFVEIGLVRYTAEQRQLWKDGYLWLHWFDKYPQLFDGRDLDLVKTQAVLNYHFAEWLAAIVLYSSTGYYSLVSMYEFSNHERKHALLKELVPTGLYEAILQNRESGGPQCPDLLMYHPDKSNWFFCEVKEPGDRMRKSQRDYFERLSAISLKPIRIIKLRELST
jgi:hypothetical protein